MEDYKVSLLPKEVRELISQSYPSVRFLSEEEQTKYEKACECFPERAREVLSIGRKGSNLFKVLLLNQIGIRTATLEELELALENGFPLKANYEDCPEIVLKSAGDPYRDSEGNLPNDYLAKSLAKNLEVTEFKAPLVVSGLELVADNDSYYGLSFKRTDRTRSVEAPDLMHRNHQRRFIRINPDYSIDFNDKAQRVFFTRPEGISRLYLRRYLLLDSRNEYLAGSDGNGRVVVVNSAEGAQNFLAEYVFRLKEELKRANEFNEGIVREAIEKLKR